MYITNYDGRLEQMAGYCEDLYINLAKANEVYTDDVFDVYSKSLPVKYIDLLSVKSIGGKTLVFNQLVDSGTTEVPTISGNKYYTLINGSASIITGDGTDIAINDDTEDMVVDLTLCFGGSGYAPTTISGFTDVFPAAHYDYNEGQMLSADVTSIVSKDTDDATIDTYTVPDAIRFLDGYGRGATGSVYNEVDFKNKKFIQRVGSVDLGTLEWASGTGFNALMPDDSAAPVSAGLYATISIFNRFNGSSSSSFLSKEKVMTVNNANFSASKRIYVHDSSYADADTFKAAMRGKYLFYKLQTPVETDISEYLTDNITLDVEAGGTLIFPNSNGSDYCIPVPVELEYIGV